MKRRYVQPEDSRITPFEALCRAFAALKGPAEVREFLRDLCTPAELESMSDRWRVVPMVLEGIPYRDIHDRTSVSVTTIGRVARTLQSGTGYHAALRHLGHRTHRHHHAH